MLYDNITIDRRGLLEQLVSTPDDYLMVSGLAGSSKDAAQLTDDGAHLFTMAGCMGAAVSMGLGMALVRPEREIMVITGDGEMMMNMGALATVATMAPSNLSIICMDNGCHGETGGQTGHTSKRTDLEKIAEGAGLPSTMTLFDPADMGAAKDFLTEAPAPRFLLCRVIDGPASAFKRNMNPAECRVRFRTHAVA